MVPTSDFDDNDFGPTLLNIDDEFLTGEQGIEYILSADTDLKEMFANESNFCQVSSTISSSRWTVN